MTTHLIDTNVAIDLLNDPAAGSRGLGQRGRSMLSVVSLVELESGTRAVPGAVAERRDALSGLLEALVIVPFDRDTAEAYGDIVERLGFSRRRILDRMIAATALVLKTPLITANVEDFAGVPGLRVEPW